MSLFMSRVVLINVIDWNGKVTKIGKILILKLPVETASIIDNRAITIFQIHNFQARSDRNKHGGGIMAYVRCDLAHRRRTDLENVVVTPVESLVLEVVLRQIKRLFVCLYSPSNSAKKQCCDSISTIFDVTATECIAMPFIIGDLNVNMSCPSDANNLKDVMDMHGLYNLVHEPTCFKGKTPGLIDVILTCNVKRVVPTINFDTGLSDFHNMVCFATKIHVPRSQENVITYRSYKKFDDENFKHDVENAPYHVGEIFDDFDNKFWFQKKLMEGVINGHAPIKRRKALKKQFLLWTLSYERHAIIKQCDEINISGMEEQNHFGNCIEKVETRPQNLK